MLLPCRACELVTQGVNGSIVSLMAHPIRAEFLLLLAGGEAQSWDILSHRLLVAHNLHVAPTCGLYTKDGKYLVVGSASGSVAVFQADSFALVADLKHTKKVTL